MHVGPVIFVVSGAAAAGLLAANLVAVAAPVGLLGLVLTAVVDRASVGRGRTDDIVWDAMVGGRRFVGAVRSIGGHRAGAWGHVHDGERDARAPTELASIRSGGVARTAQLPAWLVEPPAVGAPFEDDLPFHRRRSTRLQILVALIGLTARGAIATRVTATATWAWGRGRAMKQPAIPKNRVRIARRTGTLAEDGAIERAILDALPDAADPGYRESAREPSWIDLDDLLRSLRIPPPTVTAEDVNATLDAHANALRDDWRPIFRALGGRR